MDYVEKNGRPGTRYNRSKHGWIDPVTFEEWFVTQLLPVMRKQEGKKVMIGDNLSSHLGLKVLKLCKENQVILHVKELETVRP